MSTSATTVATAPRSSPRGSEPPLGSKSPPPPGALVEVFGIRHHGPGSARSVVAALNEFAPDTILVEGPADADPLLAYAASESLEPPVALFAYAANTPQLAAFWPLAVFSPEWQAIRWASEHHVSVAFCDLPAASTLALTKADADARAADTEADLDDPPVDDLRGDPLGALAHAAGYDDAETWWEDVVESREGGIATFAAITEAMAALRAELPDVPTGSAPSDAKRQARREAHMRQQIRATQKSGARRIAVICGAWHAPALTAPLPPAAHDAAVLRGLPKTKVTMTWVPWTHSRLAASSGYGAGVTSPGWYHHLYVAPADAVPRWLTRVASTLRDEDLPISSAHVIEAVRLADTLAVMRGRPSAGLAEVSEATLSVMCDGNPLALDLVTRRLVVGEEMGSVPDAVPAVPLETDLAGHCRRLRIKREALEKVIDLDLRKDNDAERSRLWHRLNLLGVTWAEPSWSRTSNRGTFRETWTLRWEPELVVKVVEAAMWGTTVEAAATEQLRDRAANEPDLAVLSQSVDAALLSGLSFAVPDLLQAIRTRAALNPDIGRLMAAIAPLVRTSRYGDVRGTDTAAVADVVDTLLVRICAGLPAATVGINADAARELVANMHTVHAAVVLHDETEPRERWLGALTLIATRREAAPLVAGWVVRTLRDAGKLSPDDAAHHLRLALSRGAEPEEKSEWVEGFLSSGGDLLVHDTLLLGLLDEWVCSLNGEDFVTVLPLLRRTLGTFDAPVRRNIGQQIRVLGKSAVGSRGGGSVAPGSVAPGSVGWDVDDERGARGLVAAAAIFGISAARPHAVQQPENAPAGDVRVAVPIGVGHRNEELNP